jgi:predicted kinase
MAMPQQQTVYLIYGPTAAGKSTVARQLAARHKAVRFAIDEWMHSLFGPDTPEKMDMAWVVPRVARCQARIWATCEEILASGRDVVLEMGLLRRQDRDRMQSQVEASGHTAALCFVDASLATRRQRVLHRNQQQGDTYTFQITPTMFDAMEHIFERPAADEVRRSRVFAEEPAHV